MSSLSQYIEKVEEYKNKNPELKEVELIRHVYLELGQRFSFDVNFLPFGNREKREKIYRKGRSIKELNECMESNVVICKSSAYLLEYILKHFGVNIKTVIEVEKKKRCPHVYNEVIPKNGKPYILDLQDDIPNIQSHSFTKNFGLSTEDGKSLVISRFEQEQMDRKLGYIDDEHYYSDDYLYLIKSDIGYFEDFGEKVKFVLENIDIYDNPNMKYADRQWHHVHVLEKLFSREEFNFQENNRKIRMINCYKDVKGNRQYVNFIHVQTKRGIDMYVYNKKEYKYSQISLKDFARAVKNGLVIHNCSVPGLNNALKELKEEER